MNNNVNGKKDKMLRDSELEKTFECLEKHENGELTAEECRKELGINKASWNRLLGWKQRIFHKK